MNQRHGILALALIATLALVWLGESAEVDGNPDDAEIVEPVKRAARRDSSEAASASGPVQPNLAVKPDPVALGDAEASPRFPIGGADLFPAQSWLPPPPPPPKVEALPPPPPQAPELPFKYVGRWSDGERKTAANSAGESAFLSLGEQVFSMQVGQTRASWRLDSINPQGLQFTYLPLQQQRQLRFAP